MLPCPRRKWYADAFVYWPSLVSVHRNLSVPSKIRGTITCFISSITVSGNRVYRECKFHLPSGQTSETFNRVSEMFTKGTLSHTFPVPNQFAYQKEESTEPINALKPCANASFAFMIPFQIYESPNL